MTLKLNNKMTAVALAGALAPSILGAVLPGVTPVTLTPLTASQEKAVIVHDINLLQNTTGVDLSFKRVIGQLLTSAGFADTKAARESLVRRMLDKFTATSAVNRGVAFPVVPNDAVAALNPAALMDPTNDVDGMRLVAVVDRLERAQSDGVQGDCGEHRMIFAKGDGRNIFNRGFFILEPKMQRPGSGQPITACLPLAKKWDGLRKKSGLALARDIEQIFFTGIPGFLPAIHAANFDPVVGGQFRTDMFMDGIWELRQFGFETKAGKPTFTMRPVEDTPFPGFYQDIVLADPKMEGLRKTFPGDFINRVLPALFREDIAAKAGGRPMKSDDLIFKLATDLPGKYDMFRSVSSTFEEDPRGLVSASFADATVAKVVSFKLPYQVTPEQIFARGGLAACSICHETGNFADIAKSNNPAVSPFIGAPASLGFVHVAEDGNISDRLRQVDLPKRLKALWAFIANPTSAREIVMADTATLSEVARKTATVSKRVKDGTATEGEILDAREMRAKLPGDFVQHLSAH